MTRLPVRSMLVAWLVCLSGASWADQPSGAYVIDLSGDPDVLDPFLDFVECDTRLGVKLCISLDMTPDGRGRYAGTALFEFSGGVTGTLTGPASGSASCTMADPRTPSRPLCKKAAFRIDTVGQVDGLASAIRCKVNGRVDHTRLWEGHGSCRIKIVGAKGGKVRGSFTHQVPPGPWTLTVVVAPVDAKKLAATASTSHGLQFVGAGKYDEKKDESTLALKGLKGTTSAGSGLKLKKLATDGGAIQGGQALIKILGTRGRVDLD